MPSPLRQEHTLGLLRAAVQLHDAEGWKRTKSALLEVPRRLNLSGSPSRWTDLARFYDETASSYCSDAKLRSRIPDLADIWHRQDLGVERLANGKRHGFPLPLELSRQNLYALSFTGDLPRLWSAGSREDFLSTRGDGRDMQDRRYIRRLAIWMQMQSYRHAAGRNNNEGGNLGKSVMVSGGRGVSFNHPLSLESRSRNFLNLFEVINSAIKAADWPVAAQTLVREPLKGRSVVHRGDVLISTDVALRQLIERHPELARALRAKQPLGRLRLTRAIKHNDLPLLESIALQFHGTAVGNAAQSRLADRELSMREFLRAGERYRRLIALAPAEMDQWKARYRLAMALSVRKVGEPVTKPVSFSGRMLSPDQFEAIIARALQARTKRREKSTAGDRLPEAPGDSLDLSGKYTVQVPETKRWRSHRGTPLDPFWSRDALDFGWAFQGDLLYFHQPGRLTACNTVSGEVRFDVSVPIEERYTWLTKECAKPLVLGSRVYVPFYREKRRELTCFDGSSGKVIWRQALDDTILGEPVACDGTILTFSLKKKALAGVIRMHRLDPATGQSVLSRPVALVEMDDTVFRMGRPIVHKDSILFRTGCSVICCDLYGQPRWTRRLPYTPPLIEANYYNQRALSPLLVTGNQVIIASPGSWQVECRDIETGERRWIYQHPNLRKVVGVVKGRVILAAGGEIQAIDVKRGEVVWRKQWPGNPRSILLARDGTVLAPAREKETTQIHCYQATHGRLVNVVELKMPLTVDRMFTDGRRVICVRSSGSDETRRRLEFAVLSLPGTARSKRQHKVGGTP